jgi:hypothetical protein
MKKLGIVCGLAALSLATFSLALRGAENAKEDEPSFWMKKKLEYAERILEGLTSADFEAISKNARMMQQLNKIEEFVRGRDEAYDFHLKSFHYANRELIRQAAEEDIDGAALAYTQLTMSCVNCHTHLRDGK